MLKFKVKRLLKILDVPLDLELEWLLDTLNDLELIAIIKILELELKNKGINESLS